jgi:hypothetical protein
MLGGFRFPLRRSGGAKIPTRKRPSSRMFHARCSRFVAASSASRCLAMCRNKQSAQPGKTVGGYAAHRYQFGKRFFGLRSQEASALPELIEKGSAMLTQKFRDCLRVCAGFGDLPWR